MFASVILFVVLLLSYESLKVEAPVSIIEHCRQNISKAKNMGIEQYESELIAQASNVYQAIMQEWSHQNEKAGFNRNFDKIHFLADSANSLISTAIDQAMHQAKYLKHISNQKINSSRLALHEFKNEFGEYPFEHLIYSGVAACELKAGVANQAHEREDFREAVLLSEEIESNLDSMKIMIGSILVDYFSQYASWKKQESDLINKSLQQHTRVLVVDKIAHSCKLYNNGKLVKEYKVELGKNWIGDKNHQGDKATPEGMYQVTRKLQPQQTKYHKALLLNYPNKDDQQRYRENIDKGHISQATPIGGLIEIHGEGGKGIDWTDGCIALQNQDMDDLFSYAEAGMEVLIIGSSRNLSEIHQLN